MTVLRGELATAQSKALIRIFKGMKDYISESRALIGTDDIARLAIQTSENTAAIAKITDEMLRKSDLPKIFKNFASSDTGKEFLIMNGQLAEADAAYQEIYAKAKNSIFIIDEYIGIKSIMHLRNVNPGVMITVFSDNKQSHLRRADLNDFRNEFPGIPIDFKKTNNTMHDRYIILDYRKRSEKIYHCGASSKDAGKKTTTIMEVQDRAVYKQLMDMLDVSDKHYDRKYQDMQDMLDNLYDKVSELEDTIANIDSQINGAYEKQITAKQLYKILANFDKLYYRLTDLEKKEFLRDF